MDNANGQAMQYRRRDVLRVCSSYYRNTPRDEKLALIESVAARYDVTLDQVLSRSRSGRIAAARKAAMMAVWMHYGDSSPVIGRLFNRDHTTVLAAIGMVAKRRSGDNGDKPIAPSCSEIADSA